MRTLIVHPCALPFACVLIASACALPAADDEHAVLVLHQSYSVSRAEGNDAKDVQQILYLGKHFIRIDEFPAAGRPMSETLLVDLKKETITTLDHGRKTLAVEDFKRRRERIKRRREKARMDLRVLPEGPQKVKTRTMYRALLDGQRTFRIDRKGEKDVGGVTTTSLRIVDSDNADYVPIETFLHKTIRLPYNNAEVLYLLQIIGEGMSKFLRERQNKELFQRLPMEMWLDMAAGGNLHTHVTKIEFKEMKDLPEGHFTDTRGYDEVKAPAQVVQPDNAQVKPD